MIKCFSGCFTSHKEVRERKAEEKNKDVTGSVFVRHDTSKKKVSILIIHSSGKFATMKQVIKLTAEVGDSKIDALPNLAGSHMGADIFFTVLKRSAQETSGIWHTKSVFAVGQDDGTFCVKPCLESDMQPFKEDNLLLLTKACSIM
jgi:hypothetical protein